MTCDSTGRMNSCLQSVSFGQFLSFLFLYWHTSVTSVTWRSSPASRVQE